MFTWTVEWWHLIIVAAGIFLLYIIVLGRVAFTLDGRFRNYYGYDFPVEYSELELIRLGGYLDNFLKSGDETMSTTVYALNLQSRRFLTELRQLCEDKGVDVDVYQPDTEVYATLKFIRDDAD